MCLKDIIASIRKRVWSLRNRKRFAYLAHTAVIQKQLRMDGRENISIGERVIIQKMTWLAAVPLTGADKCSLNIGAGSVIGNFNHIYATCNITIGKDVLTADKVYISDCAHHYEDILTPVVKQPIKQLSTVTIGDGAWLGENVCVIGSSVGKGSVVGANSVVLSDIPNYCVAVGSPAKVIKKYNFETQQWEKI